MRIACFISSHGFGHATRTFAVLEELSRKNRLHLALFSTLPDWFIEKNLTGISYESFHLKTDVGLVQKNPFEHDLESTVQELDQFLEFREENILPVIKIVNEHEPDFIFCDISPLGLFVGNKLGIPTCLLENFTWDWIYQQYEDQKIEFLKHIEYLTEINSFAYLHIQTVPFCKNSKRAKTINPIFRPPNHTADLIKNQIGAEKGKPILLVTTGGIPQQYKFIDKIINDKSNFYILAGNFNRMEIMENYLLMPHQNKFHFPDLVSVANALVGKVGYGILAESWGAQKALMGIFRNDFRESNVLRKFAQENVPGFEITNENFQSGNWIDKIKKLLNQTSSTNNQIKNGKNQAARILNKWKLEGFKRY